MFINRKDILTLIHGEKIDAISRNDERHLNEAIAYGIEEVAGYMGRFDTEKLLAPVDIYQDDTDFLDPQDFESDFDDPEEMEHIIVDNRDPLLKGLVVVCAAWYFIGVANVGVDYAIIEDRYTKAIDKLKGVQSGKVSPRNWPLKAIDPITGNDPAQIVRYGSNRKRTNHF